MRLQCCDKFVYRSGGVADCIESRHRFIGCQWGWRGPDQVRLFLGYESDPTKCVKRDLCMLARSSHTIQLECLRPSSMPTGTCVARPSALVYTRCAIP